MATALLENGRIETTEPKAKELRGIVEKMITLGKQGDLAARRQALAYLLDEDVVKDLFDNIGKKYAERQGGYTRIIKAGVRRGDAAPMVIVELV
jgi:large subunit ribosomal protein L17